MGCIICVYVYMCCGWRWRWEERWKYRGVFLGGGELDSRFGQMWIRVSSVHLIVRNHMDAASGTRICVIYNVQSKRVPPSIDQYMSVREKKILQIIFARHGTLHIVAKPRKHGLRYKNGRGTILSREYEATCTTHLGLVSLLARLPSTSRIWSTRAAFEPRGTEMLQRPIAA